MTGTKHQWLGSPITFSESDQADLDAVRSRVRELDRTARLNRGDRSAPHADAHAGEVQSIVHARRNKHLFISNDDSARQVAREHKVHVGTTVDLVRQLIAEERADAILLARDLTTLQSRSLDTGEHITGPQDLYPRKVGPRRFGSTPP